MGRLRQLSLVWNGRSGNGTRRAGLAKTVGAILTRPPNPQKIYGPQTLAELESIAQQIHRDRPDILALAGGDGTLHRTLTPVITEHLAMQTPLPDILLVPTGTMNNAAEAFGIRRLDPVTFATRIAEKLRRGLPFDYVHARPLRVNNEYGFLYGAGVPVHLLERYYADRASTGAVRAAQVVTQTFWDELLGLLRLRRPQHYLTKPVRARCSVFDGGNAPGTPFTAYTGLMVGAIDRVGVGCKALPHAMDTPDRFTVRATQLSFWGLVRNLVRIWIGAPLPHTRDAVVEEVTIEYAKPTVTQIDGELKAPTTRDVITPGPLLRFIVG